MEERKELHGRYYDMSAETYHAQHDFVGSSSLVHMRKSPLHFKSAWQAENEPTPAMDRGTFMHDVILAQDLSRYVARPVKEDGSLVRSNSNEYKEWLAANEGKTVVAPALFEGIDEMLASVRSHGPFMELYRESFVEVSLFARDEKTEQKIKARCDLIPYSNEFILDVKTCANIDRFERDLFAMNYDVRLLHYANTVKALSLDSNFDVLQIQYYFLAVESAAPFGCKLFQLDMWDVAAADKTWRMWMNMLRVCREDDRWPGYSQDTIVARRPAYTERTEEPTFE